VALVTSLSTRVKESPREENTWGANPGKQGKMEQEGPQSPERSGHEKHKVWIMKGSCKPCSQKPFIIFMVTSAGELS